MRVKYYGTDECKGARVDQPKYYIIHECKGARVDQTPYIILYMNVRERG